MKKINVLLLLLCTSAAFCQEKKGNSYINFTYAQQYYYNSNHRYVRNDNKLPNPIHPKNTLGHIYSIGYERITRYGLVLYAGLGYGVQRHDINITVDLTNFDSNATNNLKGRQANERIQVTSKFFNPQISVGYSMKIAPNWHLISKIGVTQKRFFTGRFATILTNIAYSYDNDSTVVGARVMATEVILGHDAKLKEKSEWGPSTFEWYFGTIYSINKSWVKNISVGVEGSLPLSANGGDILIARTRGSVSQNEQKDVSNDMYINKNISLGVRLGVSFWR